MIRRRRAGTGYSYVDEIVRPDGTLASVKLPGVTRILEMQPKPWMKAYTARTCAAYAAVHWDELSALDELERQLRIKGAADRDMRGQAARGTAVHRLGELLLAGEEVDASEPLRPHAESYAAFLDAYDVAVIAVELAVFNRHVGYGGTLDLIADLAAVRWRGQVIPPARWLLDVKTGRGIRSKDALQACGYSRAEGYLGTGDAERPMAELGVEHCAAVHVRGDGWDLVPLDTGDQAWAYFKHLAWLWYHDEFPDGWVGEAAEPPAAVAAAP